MSGISAEAPSAAVNRYLVLAGVLLAAFVIALLILANSVELAGAVIAEGQVTVASEVKRVQHPTGGVVADIKVKDGDHVRAGDVLLSLDPSSSAESVAIVSDEAKSLIAKRARLEAERDGADNLSFAGAPGTDAKVRIDEDRLFRLHKVERTSQKAQLAQRISQLKDQISGYDQAISAKQKQIQLIDGELAGVRDLFRQNLVPIARLNALERDAVQLRGDIAQLRASIAEAEGKISELGIQSLQIDQSARSQAGSQLSEVETQLAEFRQRGVAAEQEFKRVQIRAPQDGVVDHLVEHTVGGVIAAGETIMLIVPSHDRLEVRARIKPTDIDHVRSGQYAMLRFSAFDQRTTPEMKATITHVSAQSEADEKSGATYYVINIDIPVDEQKRAGLALVPGMPVEAFIQTDRRSILSFIIKPLADQISRSFRG